MNKSMMNIGIAIFFIAVIIALYQNNLLTLIWLYISTGAVLVGVWLMYWFEKGSREVKNERKR